MSSFSVQGPNMTRMTFSRCICVLPQAADADGQLPSGLPARRVGVCHGIPSPDHPGAQRQQRLRAIPCRLGWRRLLPRHAWPRQGHVRLVLVLCMAAWQCACMHRSLRNPGKGMSTGS